MIDTPARENPDHETLARLARENPEAFERLRRDLLDGLIDRAPEHLKPRLRGVQFRVDQVRQLAHTPLNATIRISELMWKSFLALGDELSGRTTHVDAPPSAKVIDFRRSAIHQP